MKNPRIALLATFEPSLPSMKAELEQLAAARNASVRITTKAAPLALAALQAGDGAGHDTQIAAAAADPGDCDALLLCQFSMASAAERIPACDGLPRQAGIKPGPESSAIKRLDTGFAPV